MNGNRAAGKIYLTGVGVVLCLLSGIFLWLMTRSYLRSSRMAEWPQHEAVILVAEPATVNWGGTISPSYVLRVLYRYRVGEMDYESDRYALRGSPRFAKQEVVEKMAENFPVGQVVMCWVDPSNPAMAVLKVDSRAPGYSLWFPGLFFLGGVGMIVGAWKKSEKSDRSSVLEPLS